MMRLHEALVFFSLATALHAGAWTLAPLSSGAASSGDAGTDTLTLTAATAAEVAAVQAWQRAPQIAEPTPSVTLPQAIDTMDRQPSAEAAKPPMPAPHPQLAALSAPPERPTADTRPAEPQHVAAATTRPKARPDRPERSQNSAAPSATQPAQRAAGKAQQAPQGTGGQAQIQSQTPDGAHALRASWGARIHAEVQRNMRFPQGVRASGTTKLTLTVARNGELRGLELARSSGNQLIDQAAMKAVHRAGRFAKAPPGLLEPTYAFSLSLNFRR